MNRPEDRADDGSTSSPHEIVYLDPATVLNSALKHLFAVASINPEIVQGCPGILEESADALEIGREMGLR